MILVRKRPQIICATSLSGGEEAFRTLGDVVMVPEKNITADVIKHADILATRSKVKVNDALLANSRLSFYGTATAGFDHVDVPALERRGITWSQAPGSNANSVAEYVMAALAWLGLQRQLDWSGKTLAIVGAGHVGSRLAKLAEVFDLNVLLNDPPLHAATGDSKYLPLADVLARADIVSLHVPLVDDGSYPTRAMINRDFFNRMKAGAVLINASRGEVMDESALSAAMRFDQLFALMLDVFEHEPDIAIDTLCQCDLATPHIAGYSLDARFRGTEMVYQAACRHVGMAPVWSVPRDEHPAILPRESPVCDVASLYEVIVSAYNPGEDDRRLRALPVGEPMALHFQHLRATYPERREFGHYAFSSADASPPFAERLRKLGFIVQS